MYYESWMYARMIVFIYLLVFSYFVVISSFCVGKDVLAKARTGTGKTVTFLVGI